MSSAVFWRLVDRLQIPDLAALELIGYAGEYREGGQAAAVSLVVATDALGGLPARNQGALQSIGEGLAWLQSRNRSAPFSGRTPIKLMIERDGEGLAEVLQFLNLAALKRSLR